MLLGVSGGRGPPAPPLVGGAAGSGAAAAARPSSTFSRPSSPCLPGASNRRRADSECYELSPFC